MPRNILLCALVALSTLLIACSDNRTAAFCESACACNDPDGTDGCALECTAEIDSAESFNSGPPLVSDECFACVDNATCPIILSACSIECAALFQSLGQQPQPGDPIDTN